MTKAFASMLNVVTDRLAVLCTSPINNHRTLGSDFTKIWPLSNIRIRKLKTVLDAIVTTKEQPSSVCWANTIRVAMEILSESTVPDPESEVLQDTFGHVVILTNNAKGVEAKMLSHEKIQFHIVCPESVPLTDFDAINCNGWKISSIDGIESPPVKPSQNLESLTVMSRLGRLIAQARSEKWTGKLTYLSLDIKAGPNCSIKSIMGSHEFLSLHPGELRTILVRVKVHASRTQDTALASSTTLPEFGPGSDVLLEELDKMLNVVPRSAKILSARLNYKHSLLPAGTTCSVRADCRVMRRIASTYSDARPEKTTLENRAECAVTVQKRLAYHLATSATPRDALSAFRTEFGEDGLRSFCPEYTHLILKELKYQSRIVERIEIEASPRKPLFPLSKSLTSSPQSDSEYFSAHSPAGTETRKPGSRFMTISEDGSLESNDKLAILPGSRNSTTNSNSSAKELVTSTTQAEPHSMNARWSTDSPHRRSESQPVVLRNKRSIGAQTLRRLNSAGESVMKGLGAL